MAPKSVSPFSERIRAEQIRMLYRTGPLGVQGAAVATLFLAAGLYYIGSSARLGAILWLACVAVVVGGHLALCRRFWRTAPLDAACGPWARWFVAFSAAEGAIWGAASIALTTPGNVEQHLLALMSGAAVASGALAVFGVYLPAFYALLFPFALPYEVASIAGSSRIDHVLAILAPIYIAAYALLALRINAGLVEALRLRFENQDLARELRLQKEAAEQANVAKSKFLAAASHDLRQPVHAVGLLVGALQGHPMTDEMRRLVEQVGGSVTAMDSLFNSLLDISRLDAGVVDPRIEDFLIEPLLERVCRDHGEEAEAKGLSLTWPPCSGTVRTDPLLLERILRNLVSNAVRYTDRGRIMVGCRRGARLRVEVWDTGRGIAADQQPFVFREFFQVGNPERDRAKGLGLGLAIVERLAKLIDCPVTLRSTPGKGSVFSIAVPLTERPVLRAQPTPAPPLAATPRGLILVIDDDTVIQSAMHSLLSSWGHDVVVGGSCAEILEIVAQRPRRPDLIVCDYRLRDGENGVEVIKRLQSEYGERIPAVLVTGDTAPDRLKEAQESGLVLLHKPVADVRLRAAVGNLLRAQAIP